jgi:chromosome segregation ATPase
MKKYTFFLFLSYLLFSCTGQSEYEKLMNENATLREKYNNLSEEEKLVRKEYSSAVTTLSAIEDSLKSINLRDKELKKAAEQMENSGNLEQKQEILKKLQLLMDENRKSKNQAIQLQAKMRGFKVENEQLRRMIAQAETRLLAKEQELEKTQLIIDDLRITLNRMETQVLESRGELNVAYDNLKVKNEELTAINQRLSNTLSDLKGKTSFIEEQAKAYVSCGTKKVLRQKGILSKTNLKLTKEYQVAVKANSSNVNYYNSDVIECGADGEIDLILPIRDPASYEIQGYKLLIKNNELFWKTDKVVVIIKND